MRHCDFVSEPNHFFEEKVTMRGTFLLLIENQHTNSEAPLPPKDSKSLEQQRCFYALNVFQTCVSTMIIRYSDVLNL